jgi:hypothetical protein
VRGSLPVTRPAPCTGDRPVTPRREPPGMCPRPVPIAVAVALAAAGCATSREPLVAITAPGTGSLHPDSGGWHRP